jgi:hypothetical protein
MTEIGIDPETVDRVLNHAIPSESRVTKVYQTNLMWAKLNEERNALERWAEHLDQVILKGRGREIARQAISTRAHLRGLERVGEPGSFAEASEASRNLGSA